MSPDILTAASAIGFVIKLTLVLVLSFAPLAGLAKLDRMGW